MPKKIKLSVKTKIIIPLVVIIILSLSIVTALTNGESQKLLKSGINELLQSDAGKMEAIVEQWEENSWAVVNAIYELPEVQAAVSGGSTVAANDALARLYKNNIDLGGYPLYANMLVLDKDFTIVSSGLDEGRGLNIMKDVPPYQENCRQAQQGNSWVSQVEASPITGLMEVWYSKPIMRGGQCLGMVAVPVHTQGLTKYLNDQSGGTNGSFIFVADKANKIATSTDNALINQNFEQLGIPTDGSLENNKTFEYKALDSRVKIGYMKTSGSLGWTIFSVVDKAAAMSSNSLLIGLIASLIVILLASAILFIIVSRITKPITNLTLVAGQLAAGNINVNITVDSEDEIGQLQQSFATMAEHIAGQVSCVQSISKGDLTRDVEVRTEQDAMSIALRELLQRNNRAFTQIAAVSQQVATGSQHIADSSQALAQGATQQASAVDQLSASIGEVAEKTKDNANLAGRAAMLGNTIKGNAEKGSQQMDEMMAAVQRINEASQSINKVIKVIDDIAFQTNILALNAAVEAARAGQHGKGFAVVAGEVRNLAAKSAEAAKDTSVLIADSMEKAELGARIASETAASLTEIVSGINESSQIVSDIAKSTQEQTSAISQINIGIDQVAQVVQQNSATAQESAAASEEMNGQSNMLEDLIEQFKLKIDDGINDRKTTIAPSMSLPETSFSFSPPGDTYDKY